MGHFFTGCIHDGHESIINLCKRPFTNSDDMHVNLVNNINKTVKNNDELFILGDIVWWGGGRKEYINRIVNFREKLNCNKITLIIGNHDIPELIPPKLFESIVPYKEISINKIMICMSHYPFGEWNKKFRGSWMLHSHSHYGYKPGHADDFSGGLILDVGMDNTESNYRPFSYEQIFRIMDWKKSQISR